jgi:orotidine-5'-phosphate decarboxylase
MSELERVVVALDTADRDRFDGWCAFFGPRVGVLKVGLEAFVRWGPDAVRTARGHAKRLFLDLKLHDIPNTVAGAVRSARSLGADYLTLHAGGGRPMLAAAAEAAAGEIHLLGVTLLTHLGSEELDELKLGDGRQRVLDWAALAADAGCAGVVCSPREVGDLRAAHAAPFQLVTPGIRWGDRLADDQRRVATPESALAAGADLLVIGRPLTRAPDPSRALTQLAERLGATR